MCKMRTETSGSVPNNSKATPWSKEEYAVLDGIIELIRARASNGYDPEDAGVTFIIDADGEETSDMSVEEFAEALLEELEDIQDGGRTFMQYHIDEAKGNIVGMMGIDADDCE